MTDVATDRRACVRVPMSGSVRWQSGGRQGTCRLLNISPHGAALLAPEADARLIGPRMTLDILLTDTMNWRISDDARVLRRTPHTDSLCEIAVNFRGV